MADNSFANLTTEKSDISFGLLHDYTNKSLSDFLLNEHSLHEGMESSFNVAFNNLMKKKENIIDFARGRIDKICKKIDISLKKEPRKSLSLFDLNSSSGTDFLKSPKTCQNELVSFRPINTTYVESPFKGINTTQDCETLHVPVNNASTTLRRSSSVSALSGMFLRKEFWTDDTGDDLLMMVPCWDDSIGKSEEELDDWCLPKLKLTPRKQLSDQSIIDSCRKKLVKLSLGPKEQEVTAPVEVLNSTYSKEMIPLKGEISQVGGVTLPKKRHRRSGSVPRNMNSSLKHEVTTSTEILSSTYTNGPERLNSTYTKDSEMLNSSANTNKPEVLNSTYTKDSEMLNTTYTNEPEILNSTYTKELEMVTPPKGKNNVCQEQLLQPSRPVAVGSKKPEASTKQKGPLKASVPIKNMVKNAETPQVNVSIPKKKQRRSGSVPRNMNSSLNGSFTSTVPVAASTPVIELLKSFRFNTGEGLNTVKERKSLSHDKNRHLNSSVSSQNKPVKSSQSTDLSNMPRNLQTQCPNTELDASSTEISVQTLRVNCKKKEGSTQFTIPRKPANPQEVSNNTKCQKTIKQPKVLKDSTFSNIANSNIDAATISKKTSKLPIKNSLQK